VPLWENLGGRAVAFLDKCAREGPIKPFEKRPSGAEAQFSTDLNGTAEAMPFQNSGIIRASLKLDFSGGHQVLRLRDELLQRH
jgi:hypothetical protein